MYRGSLRPIFAHFCIFLIQAFPKSCLCCGQGFGLHWLRVQLEGEPYCEIAAPQTDDAASVKRFKACVSASGSSGTPLLITGVTSAMTAVVELCVWVRQVAVGSLGNPVSRLFAVLVADNDKIIIACVHACVPSAVGVLHSMAFRWRKVVA